MCNYMSAHYYDLWKIDGSCTICTEIFEILPLTYTWFYDAYWIIQSEISIMCVCVCMCVWIYGFVTHLEECFYIAYINQICEKQMVVVWK